MSCRAAILITLFDDDSVVSDARKSNVLIGDAAHRASGTRDGLDAYTCTGQPP